MELFYQRWPTQQTEISKEKPTLVLLHGMGGTGALWRPIGAFLEESFNVIAPDQRGHGQSRVTPLNEESLKTFTPLDYAQDVVETLSALNITNVNPKVGLIGHSMGVRTACGVAHLRPDLVSKMMLVDLGVEGQAGGGLGDTLKNFLAQMPDVFPSRAEAREHMRAHCPDPAIVQYLMAVSQVDTKPGSSGTLRFPFDKEALMATIDAAEGTRVRDWVREAAGKGVESLLLHGGRSQVWNEAEYRNEIENFKDVPQVRFEQFADAGHGLPFEKRPEFVELVKQFFS